MRQLPTGTVSLLFTDIEGSTRLLGELGRRGYVPALTEHRRLLRAAFETHGGVEVEMQGDSFFYAFPYARDAVAAAAAGQHALAEHRWQSQAIRVRMGVHTGEPEEVDGLYAGMDVHRAARIMSTAYGGQVLVSERTADLVDGELPEGVTLRDLGEHRLKDLPGPIRLFQVGDQRFPPLRTPSTVQLPTPATRFIGRDEELLEALTLVLDDDPRCLTIVGPGGTGKTRFALELARLLSEDALGGTYWVALASARDPALVVPLVAREIGARDDTAASTVEAIAERLAGRRMLVLVDNVEHLLPEAAAAVAGLLAAAPSLRLLCTSREPLRVRGEVQYALEPLAGPDAVRLFVERARASGALLEETETVHELCRRLDGLPLALELAAARTTLLSPEQLLDRLAGRLDLQGPRDAEPRQRTLRAAIEWSYGLLAPAEQRLFRHLSAFAGGCTLAVAEEVCDADLDDLSTLLDKSLLRRRTDAAGERRFWLLETIREFGAEQLHAAGEAAQAHARTTAWAASLAAEAWRGLRGPEQIAWLARLDAEQPNLRSALDRLVEQGDGELAAGLAADLAWYWDIRSPAEGRRLLERALAAEPDGGAVVRARSWLALAAFRCGDYERAEPLARTTAALARARDDTWTEAWCLNTLGNVASYAPGRAAESAKELYERAAALAEQTGDGWLQICVGSNLAGEQTEEGRFDQAAAMLGQLCERAQARGDSVNLAYLVGNWAWTEAARGNWQRVDELDARTERLLTTLGFDWSRVVLLSTRAYGACARGDLEGADAATVEALELLLEAHPDPKVLAELIAMRGVVAARREDERRAALLFEMVHALSARYQLTYERAVRELATQAEQTLAERLDHDSHASRVVPPSAEYPDVLDAVLADARAEGTGDIPART
jgi:predicted ATPase/class 3 adenylate cyclase